MRCTKPEEIDVALGLQNLAEFTTLEVRRSVNLGGPAHLASDRTPVSGFDPAVDDFYWLVGQGGYGIHNADAMAQATAANVTGSAWPTTLADLGLAPADLAADRPGLRGPLAPGH